VIDRPAVFAGGPFLANNWRPGHFPLTRTSSCRFCYGCCYAERSRWSPWHRSHHHQSCAFVTTLSQQPDRRIGTAVLRQSVSNRRTIGAFSALTPARIDAIQIVQTHTRLPRVGPSSMLADLLLFISMQRRAVEARKRSHSGFGALRV